MTPRVAVVGSGYWGKNLVRNFHELGALAGVVDANTAAAEAVATPIGAPVRSLDDVLGDPAIDAVAVAVPAAQHAEVAEAALDGRQARRSSRSRSHSTSPTPSGCASVAAERERVLMVGHLSSTTPPSSRLRDAGTRRRAGSRAVPLLEPAQPRAHSPRGGHPLELRAARHLDDPRPRQR